MKICILGKAPSWREAPFDDENVEIWSLNDGVIKCSVPRFDRTFDVHIPSYYGRDNFYTPNHVNWLKDNQDKLWILDKCEDFSDANIIDYKMLVKKHGEYFTSSIAWMMAEALECDNVTDIYLCGIDLLQQEEYQVQRPCVEYFIGKARERGIEVHIQPSSTLLRAEKLYGIM